MAVILEHLPPNKPIRLGNAICVYCGASLDASNESIDHVIGRRFVPKGKLENEWNLIVKACTDCNNRKAELEDDISAISMLPDLTGQHGHDDEAAKNDAIRKAVKSISRRTKKAVNDSLETAEIEMPFFPGVTFTARMTAPPQVDKDRIFELARLQLVAFFYYITFNEGTKHGAFWPGGFGPVMQAHRRDWGNPVMRAFADAAAEWKTWFSAKTADEFFKTVIKKQPDALCWSWAFEWNRSTRVVGFFGEELPIRTVAGQFPKLPMHTVKETNGDIIRFREEEPLDERDDRLFCLE